MAEFSKGERLGVIWERLAAAPAASTHDEALQLLSRIIREVEDELTDIPHNPPSWQTDGRIYPPQEDNGRDVEGRADLIRYRSLAHNTYIRTNGALEVRDISENLIFSKHGADGHRVDLEN